jgi:hypothetical protein
MKIDFDQVFADATRQGEFNASIHDGLRDSRPARLTYPAARDWEPRSVVVINEIPADAT